MLIIKISKREKKFRKTIRSYGIFYLVLLPLRIQVILNYKDGGWATGQKNSLGEDHGFTMFQSVKAKQTILGQVSKGKLMGYVMHVWNTGDVRCGRYEDNEKNGLNLSIWNDGGFAFRNYKSNMINGFTITQWTDGSPDDKSMIKYIGEYKNDIRNGYGIKYYKDGSYKSGIWIDDVLSKELPKLEVLESLGF